MSTNLSLSIDEHMKNLNTIIKKQMDGLNQMTLLNTLKSIYSILQSNTLQKKKLVELQSSIEDAFFYFILNSKCNTNSLIINFIVLIYVFFFNSVLSSRLDDVINKYSSSILNSKTDIQVREVVIRILIRVVLLVKEPFTSIVNTFLPLIYKVIKNSEKENEIKSISLTCLIMIFEKKSTLLYNSLSDLFKFIFKYDKAYPPSRNMILLLKSTIFYINSSNIKTYYDQIVSMIIKYFNINDREMNQIAIETYLVLHIEKVFEKTIEFSNIKRRKLNEMPSNFLEVLFSFGQSFLFEGNSLNMKYCMIVIVRRLIEENKENMNISEKFIKQLVKVMINHFQVTYLNSSLMNNDRIMISKLKQGSSSLNVTPLYENEASIENDLSSNDISYEIEELYRVFVKVIYNSNIRKGLLVEVISFLTQFQGKLDKLENFKLKKDNVDFKLKVDPKTGKEIKEVIVEKDKEKSLSQSQSQQGNENSNSNIGFNEGKINTLFIILLEYTEHNFDLFEQVYPSFSDISKTLLIYLNSNIKSFRILVNRVLINFSYFIPSYRISILNLLIDFTSISNADVSFLKNTFIFLSDEESNEFKYSLIVKNNIEIFKDITNCLGICLSTFANKANGLSVDLSNASLDLAMKIIIGKGVKDEIILEENSSQTIKEKSLFYNYKNSYITSHKEAGWIIVQGLCSMDYTWMILNYNRLFILWRYVFNQKSCSISSEDKEKLKSAVDYELKEAFISEFFIKKSALSALRRFILTSKGEFSLSKAFTEAIPGFLYEAYRFFIEHSEVSSFCRQFLKEKYQEVRILLYDCYRLIDSRLYIKQFNALIKIIIEDITGLSNDYYSQFKNINSNNIIFSEDILNNLNHSDTLYSDYTLNLDFPIKPNSSNQSFYDCLSNKFKIDDLFIEKYEISIGSLVKTKIESKRRVSNLINSSILLLSQILMNENFSFKNKIHVFSFFLSALTGKEKKEKVEKEKLEMNLILKSSVYMNILFSVYYFLNQKLKQRCEKEKEMKDMVLEENVLSEKENLLSLIKEIFEVGIKSNMKNYLVKRIALEGKSLLSEVCLNKQKYYSSLINELETKLKTESEVEDKSSCLVILSNTIRNSNKNEFENEVFKENDTNTSKISIINEFINLTCKFIAKVSINFSDLLNPYINQSIYVICIVLLKRYEKYNEVRRIINTYKTSYFFISSLVNKDRLVSLNGVSFLYDYISLRNYNCVFKTIILYSQFNKNISSEDKDFMDFLLDVVGNDIDTSVSIYSNRTYIYGEDLHDEIGFNGNIYTSSYSKYNQNSQVVQCSTCLLFLKMVKSLLLNGLYEDFIYKNQRINAYILSLFINMKYTKPNPYMLYYEFKLLIEIIILLILKEESPSKFDFFIEECIIKLNSLFNYNKNLYFMSEIFSNGYYFNQTRNFLFLNEENSNLNMKITSKSSVSLKSIMNLIDYDLDLDLIEEKEKTGSLTKVHSRVICDNINPIYSLIQHMKIIIKISIEKNISNTKKIVDLIKDITFNPLSFYIHKKIKSTTSNSNQTVLSQYEDDKSSLSLSNSLICINNLSFYLHVDMKKFIIKQLLSCVSVLLYTLKFNDIVSIDVISLFINSSLNLINSSNEYFEIKQLGLDLLIQVIDTFKSFEDKRLDEKKLLIQEFEAQILSCIKAIFKTRHSILAPFFGLKILYKFLTIPICSDYGIFKKIDLMIDLYDLNNHMQIGSFCEKADFLFVLKKLNFQSCLYLTLIQSKKSKKSHENEYEMRLFDLVNNEIYASDEIFEKLNTIDNEYKEGYIEYFNDDKVLCLLNNLLLMIEDIRRLFFDEDKKKKFNFLYSNDRITYSISKILKYSQLYIFCLMTIVNSQNIKRIINDYGQSVENERRSEDDRNTDNFSMKTLKYSQVYCLFKKNGEVEGNLLKILFFYMYFSSNFEFSSKSQTYSYNSYVNSYENTDFIMRKISNDTDINRRKIILYTEDNVDNMLKSKLLNKILSINYLLGIFVNIINSEIVFFSINNIKDVILYIKYMVSYENIEIKQKLIRIMKGLLSMSLLDSFNIKKETSNEDSVYLNEIYEVVIDIYDLTKEILKSIMDLDLEFGTYTGSICKNHIEYSKDYIRLLSDFCIFSLKLMEFSWNSSDDDRNTSLRRVFTCSLKEILIEYKNISVDDVNYNEILKFCIDELKKILISISTCFEKVLYDDILGFIYFIINDLISISFEKSFLLFYMLYQLDIEYEKNNTQTKSKDKDKNEDEDNEKYGFYLKIILYLIDNTILELESNESNERKENHMLNTKLNNLLKILNHILKSIQDKKTYHLIEFLYEKLIFNNRNSNFLLEIFLLNEDFQSISLLFILLIENDDQRRFFIQIIILSIQKLTDKLSKEKLSQFIFRLLSKGNDFELEMKNLLCFIDKEMVCLLERYYLMKKSHEERVNSEKEKESSVEKKTSTEVIGDGKLKVLKFGKK